MGIGFVLGITASTISLIVPGRTTSVMTTVATMAPATISAVSYTHLDVYKRQIVCYEILTDFIFPNPSFIMEVIMAVIASKYF